jgi:hypothetical protein
MPSVSIVQLVYVCGKWIVAYLTYFKFVECLNLPPVVKREDSVVGQ